MALTNNSHVQVGGNSYLLDENYDDETGRRCYVHGGRSIFSGRTDITGRPGSQNIKEDYLVWAMTRFEGEGQVVLDLGDADSAFRFYRSEGLNFRVPGQFSLNKSVLSETVTVSAGANTTAEGNADFTDVSGTSTTSGTDRTLVALTDKVGMSANYTPGAVTNQVDFYLYRQGFSSYATTIQASAFNVVDGPAPVSGTDRTLNRFTSVRSANLASGSEFTAGVTTRVELYASVTGTAKADLKFQIIELGTSAYNSNVFTGLDFVVASSTLRIDSSSPTTPFTSLSFVPATGRTYRFKVSNVGGPSGTNSDVTFDKVLYGADVVNNTATIEIYNQTAGATLTSKVVTVDATAAGSVVGSITFLGVAATNYRARVTRTSGKQKITVDKVVLKPLANAAWVIDCLDFGVAQKVWLGAHAAAVDSRGFNYNTATDAWDSTSTFNDGASTTAKATLAMAHSDSLEYFLLDNNEVYTSTSAGTDDRYAYFSTGSRTLVGMCVAQNRLWLMGEDASGVIIYILPLDGASTPYDLGTDTTNVRSLTIAAGSKTADTTLRQRMWGSSSGARFFINYSAVTAKVFEVDSTQTTLAATELADLGTGVKATAITFENGLTFVAGQYYGDSSASDLDKLPRSALFAIDQNSIIQRIGFYRYDNPDPRPVQYMIPYQTSVYMLQGNYVWRYDLVSGGLFLEYQLSPQTPANNRSIAILFGRIFAAYSDEVFVAGSVGTYRQSSVDGGSTFQSSVFDFGLPSVRKSLAKLELLCDNLPSSTAVSVQYQIDQNGTWTDAGQMTQGSKQTFFITGVSFLTLQIRVRALTTDGVSTPVVKALTVWASAAEDEEYFDLVLLTEDTDSNFHVANEQPNGNKKANALFGLWRNKAVTSFVDGYGDTGGDYLVTVEDVRVENTTDGEGRTVCTLRVVR